MSFLFISYVSFNKFAIDASSPEVSRTFSSLSITSRLPSISTDVKGEKEKVYLLCVLYVDHQAVTMQQAFSMLMPPHLYHFPSLSPGISSLTRKTKTILQTNGTESVEGDLVCSFLRTVICPHGKHCCPDLSTCCYERCCLPQFPLCCDSKRRLCFNGFNLTLCHSACTFSLAFPGTMCTNSG